MVRRLQGQRVPNIYSNNINFSRNKADSQSVSAYTPFRDEVLFGNTSKSNPIKNPAAYQTLFESNTRLTSEEVSRIISAINNNNVNALKDFPVNQLNLRGKGLYPFASFALENRKWAAANFLIQITENPQTNYVFLDNLRVNDKVDMSRRTNLLLEAVYRKAPLFVIQNILRHDNLELNGEIKINGQNAYQWVNNGVDKSRNFFGFEKFHPYYKSLQTMFNQYLGKEFEEKPSFDPFMDPLLIG